MNINYQITLNKGLSLKDGTTIDHPNFNQSEDIQNDKIKMFNAGEQNADDRNDHPLTVWFHGCGESRYRGLHYNNLSQLKANRGAVAFTTDETQEIFNNAYVLAPQTHMNGQRI